MTARTIGARRATSLVGRHVLTVEIGSRLFSLVEPWLPLRLEEPGPAALPQSAMRVGAATSVARRLDGAATLTLGTVRGWLSVKQRRMRLRGMGVATRGVVDFPSRRATLRVDPSAAEAGFDLYAMLTVAAALLLAELGRALVHAAGVVSPDGGAWLLAGDARAGKSTTCANLVRAGWGYLSDDQVVLELGPAGITAEGWLRPFHLDQGWPAAEPSGIRTTISPTTLGVARWRRSAPLAGLLFPRVQPERPTTLARRSPGEALAAMVRQSPWLLVRRRTAATVLELLKRAVERVPAYALHLGRDSYRGGEQLSSWLTVAASAS